MRRLLYFLPFCFCLSMKCEREPAPTPIVLSEFEKLSAITMEGRNTFGCLVNDTAWLPNSYLSGRPELKVTYSDSTLYIRAIRWASINGQMKEAESLHFYCSYAFIDTGTYQLGSNSYILMLSAFRHCKYEIGSVISGEIYISRFDKIKRIVSGQFNQISYIDSGCDTLNISNGRFDIKF